MYEQLINRLIPADDLHYDKEQRRFFALPPQETRQIAIQCAENGVTDPAEVHKVLKWVTTVRIGEILHRSFMSGRVRIVGFKDDDPLFAPLTEAP
jgi:hypothetical protein